MTTPSSLELKNADKITNFLVDIEDISFTNLRDDIFKIKGPNNTDCILDVEETLVCIFSEICDIPNNEPKQFQVLKYLMELNNEAVHGKFTVSQNKVFFKENLEIKNIDKNELESALMWTLAMVERSVEKISTIIE